MRTIPRFSTPIALFVLLSLPFLGFSGCKDNGSGEPAGQGQPASSPLHKNVLLVTLDTTRADALSCYGSLSVAKAAGWQTAAFIGSTVLAGRLGLSQGFDSYYDNMLQGIQNPDPRAMYADRRATSVNVDFLSWLTSAKGVNEAGPGWFAWVHYFDPHYVYDPPEPFASQYASNLYFGEVAFMDDALGKIIAELKTRNMYDNTLIIAVGDHGEGLGEHGELHHSLLTYDSTLHVPLIISDPDSRGTPRRDNRSTSTIDIFPTILKWCGVDAPATPGIDLLAAPLNVEEGTDSRLVYFESMEARYSYNWAGLRGAIRDGYKYTLSPIPELYNLNDDAGETNNLYEADRDQARVLKLAMNELVDQWRAELQSPERTLSPEEIARLRSLGYLTGGITPSSGVELEKIEGLPDVKTNMAFADELGQLIREADAAFQSGDFATAKAKYHTILASADVVSAITNLGEIGLRENNERDAIDNYQRVCEIIPQSVQALYNLGLAYDTFGHKEEAKTIFRHAVEIDPTNPANVSCHIVLAKYRADEGDWQGALDEVLAGRAIDPNNQDLIGYEAMVRRHLAN
ncbi:MAG: sulfatase-like hydrolase/transferase [bacterium]|nr:sulfatase-like hydrolase/transferase [bacterium]